MAWMIFFLVGAGAFFAVEAVANLFYWKGSAHPDNGIWQAGRFLRAVLGLALVGAGFFY